jgi:hypothetical protein
MRREKDHELGTFGKVVRALTLAGAGIFAIAQLSSLRRYLRIRKISARKHATPPGITTEPSDTSPRWGTSHWPVH